MICFKFFFSLEIIIFIIIKQNNHHDTKQLEIVMHLHWYSNADGVNWNN